MTAEKDQLVRPYSHYVGHLKIETNIVKRGCGTGAFMFAGSAIQSSAAGQNSLVQVLVRKTPGTIMALKTVQYYGMGQTPQGCRA